MGRVVAALVALLMVAAPAMPAAADDVPNTTCRLDGVVAGAVFDAEVTCLQLDTETYGEFDAAVTLTLQRLGGEQWVDVADETCTGTSVEGVLSLNCSVATPEAAGEQTRGVIDLDAPKDWPAAVADPVYHGGPPVLEALAADECDAGETYDPADLTLPDAPWADLCAVTMESTVDEVGDLESVTVVTHVAGLLDQRAPTGTWVTSFSAGESCRHEITVTDSGGAGEASARVHTGCGRIVHECTGVIRTIFDLTGGVCTAGSSWEQEEELLLAADAVTFTAAEVRVTLRPDDVGEMLAADLGLGTTIGGVSARALTGVGTGPDGARSVVVDADHAYPTGRTFTIGG